MGPFAFFDLGKTKYLQILTTLFRWLGRFVSFLFMVSMHVLYSFPCCVHSCLIDLRIDRLITLTDIFTPAFHPAF